MVTSTMIVLLGVYILHYIADFWLQTDKMALNKSTSHKWLAAHVTLYSFPFLIFGWKFALITFITHYITDYFSSRAAAKAWQSEKRGLFFKIVGLDQLIHHITLLLTLIVLGII